MSSGAAVWRDYVRQSGAVMMEQADYQRLTGDRGGTDLQLWLVPGTDAAGVQRALRERPPGAGALLDFAWAQLGAGLVLPCQPLPVAASMVNVAVTVSPK